MHHGKSIISIKRLYYMILNINNSGSDITSRMQCIVGFLYAVHTATIFGVVERVKNYALKSLN